jgi:hypothetical protein
VFAVCQAATAHDHKAFATRLNAAAECSDRVSASCELAAGKVERALGRPRLAKHIRRVANARPVALPKGVAVGKTTIHTGKGALVVALWDLHHAASSAASETLAQVPAGSSPRSTASALAEALSRMAAIAQARLSEALALADAL